MSKRIGRLFSLFSAIILVYGLAVFISSGPEQRGSMVAALAFVALCSVVFLYSTVSKYGNYIQIATVAMISFPTLYLGDQKVFGVMVLFVAFALCVAYGCYDKHRRIRLGITSAVTYGVIVLCNNEINLLAFPKAAVWLAFMVFLALVMWTIFRDYMDREITVESIHIRRLISVNKQLINLAKELKTALDEIKG